MNSAGYLVEQQIKRDDIVVHVQRKKKGKKKSIIAHIFFDINSVQETELPPNILRTSPTFLWAVVVVVLAMEMIVNV